MASTIISKSVTNLLKLIYIYKEKKKSKIELENEALDFVFINLSGNLLSMQAKDEVMGWGKCKIVQKEIPNLDLSNPATYMNNIMIFCSYIIGELITKDRVIRNLLLGNYIIVPPGITSLAMVFATMFHGITRHFPEMSFFYKKGMVYNLTKSFNFQKLRTKYRDIQKSKLELGNEKQEMILINLSGFPLSPEVKYEVHTWGIYKIIEKAIPNVDLSNPQTYMENVVNFCANTIEDFIKEKEVFYNLLIGNYIVIPSIIVSLAMTFITMLHGITGHFPRMSFFYKKDLGYSLIKPFDFHDLRTKFRDIPSKPSDFHDLRTDIRDIPQKSFDFHDLRTDTRDISQEFRTKVKKIQNSSIEQLFVKIKRFIQNENYKQADKSFQELLENMKTKRLTLRLTDLLRIENNAIQILEMIADIDTLSREDLVTTTNKLISIINNTKGKQLESDAQNIFAGEGYEIDISDDYERRITDEEAEYLKDNNCYKKILRSVEIDLIGEKKINRRNQYVLSENKYRKRKIRKKEIECFIIKVSIIAKYIIDFHRYKKDFNPVFHLVIISLGGFPEDIEIERYLTEHWKNWKSISRKRIEKIELINYDEFIQKLTKNGISTNYYKRLKELDL